MAFRQNSFRFIDVELQLFSLLIDLTLRCVKINLERIPFPNRSDFDLLDAARIKCMKYLTKRVAAVQSVLNDNAITTTKRRVLTNSSPMITITPKAITQTRQLITITVPFRPLLRFKYVI